MTSSNRDHNRPTWRAVESLIRAIYGHPRSITIPISLVDFFGGYAQTALFQQIVYWSDHTNRRAGWFFKTYAEWEKETGIPTRTCRRYMKKFVAMGFLATRVKKVKGVPVLWYKLSLKHFVALHQEWIDRQKQHRKDTEQNTERAEQTTTCRQIGQMGVATPRRGLADRIHAVPQTASTRSRQPHPYTLDDYTLDDRQKMTPKSHSRFRPTGDFVAYSADSAGTCVGTDGNHKKRNNGHTPAKSAACVAPANSASCIAQHAQEQQEETPQSSKDASAATPPIGASSGQMIGGLRKRKNTLRSLPEHIRSAATELADLVRRSAEHQGQLKKTSRISTWVKQIGWFLIDERIDANYALKLMRWYTEEGITGPDGFVGNTALGYLPVIVSGRSFREKWPKLQRAYDNHVCSPAPVKRPGRTALAVAEELAGAIATITGQKQDVERWAVEIAELATRDGVPSTAVKRKLSWYASQVRSGQLDDSYIPRIFRCCDIRRKWASLCDAYARCSGQEGLPNFTVVAKQESGVIMADRLTDQELESLLDGEGLDAEALGRATCDVEQAAQAPK